MVRRFENCTATIYTLGTSTLRGSLVQTKTALYEDIRGGFWAKSRSYWPTALAVQTDQNVYTLCIAGKYTGVQLGYIVTIEGVDYKVENVISHPNSRGKIDNFELIISKSTNAN